jgi:hypothetical protein
MQIKKKFCLLVVGNLKECRLDVRDSIPGRGNIFLFSIVGRPAVGPTQLPMKCAMEAISWRVTRSGWEADHSSPSSVEVKNGGAIPPLPHMPSWHSA